MGSIYEILGLNPNIPENWDIISSEYEATEIKFVKIGNDTFTNYGDFQFVWEKSYVREPKRSGDGTIGNLNSYATFITPHLIINFSVMSIDDYRLIMKKDLSQNEFLVECYDPIYNTTTVNKMYFAPQSLAKLYTINRMRFNGNAWEEFIELAGVHDYTVELIGTNSDIDTVDILYYDKDGNLIPSATQNAYKGTEHIINYNYQPPSNFRFDGVWKDSEGTTFLNNSAVTVLNELRLYAQVVSTNQYTLSLDYGKGIVPIAKTTAQPIISVPAIKGTTIANNIHNANITTSLNQRFEFPAGGTGLQPVVYTFGGEEKQVEGFVAYTFKGWYLTSTENESTKVQSTTLYNYDTNRTIFQIYEPNQFTVSYVTNEPLISISAQTFKFGENIVLPSIAISERTFKGWFIDSTFTKPVPATMPPENFTVYAKWE